jgi:hypothetical protein
MRYHKGKAVLHVDAVDAAVLSEQVLDITLVGAPACMEQAKKNDKGRA